MWGMTANGKVQVCHSEGLRVELDGCKAAWCDSLRGHTADFTIYQGGPEDVKV